MQLQCRTAEFKSWLSVVTSVSVILNGNEPEFTDALGQKVPKPQPSLQVASPIDLLNPDRYEFYTFDEHGELVKRLMTIEEIQSIVANGDGEGPTIIHHGQIEDHDPEKNVQDIVNIVQSVLNKEVESNKNTSTESLPVLDTPDVSSTWSMILPAIFGNTGNVDVFSHQKPQQIVMTPDSEIIETSTKIVPSTSKKPKPGKRKPVQKRKSTTTTEMTPQVIQEELDSQESVYTGMQQYQSLAATMQNYDGFSQLHMQPIYHKLPGIETTTRHVFINNQELVKKPITNIDSENESLAKKPISVQRKPPPYRLKKPSGSNTTTKRPQAIKQKIKRKPVVTTTKAPIASATSTSATTSQPSRSPETTVSTTFKPIPTTTAENLITMVPTTTTTIVSNSAPAADSTTISSVTSTAKPKKKKKKPTRSPIHFPSTTLDDSMHKQHLTAENRKPSPKPHRHRPKPAHQHTKYQQTTSASDLTAEETVHQGNFASKFEHFLNDKLRPKPNKPNHNNHLPSSTTGVPSTTLIFAPTPTKTSSLDASLITQDLADVKKTMNSNQFYFLSTLPSPYKAEVTTFVDLSSTSGTSGYPVPFYDSLTDKPENSDFYQLKKYQLSQLNITIGENKQNPQDIYTKNSFDQIMQTLKYPVQTSEHSLGKINLKPVIYDSLETVENSSKSKPLLSTFENSVIHPTSTDFETNSDKNEIKKPLRKSALRPNNSPTIDLPEDITSSPNELVAINDSGVTGIPDFTAGHDIFSKLPEKEIYQTTEYQSNTQKSEEKNYAPPSVSAEYITLQNDLQVSTDIKDYMDQLPVAFSHQEESVTKVNKHPSHPIYVANLQSQLNMEVIKPSEQIKMEDFQTQAATVASTLIDGGYTFPGEYSNNTNDGIALLLADVIHQITKNKAESTSLDANRFSNQAQFDVSFLTSSTTSINNNKTLQIENQCNGSSPCLNKTEVHETSTPRETVVEEKTAGYYTTEKYILDETESIDEIDETFENDHDGDTSTSFFSEIYTTFQDTTEAVEAPTTMNEREPLFEADSSFDTTTLINAFFDESTTLTSEKSSTKVKEHETLRQTETEKNPAAELELKTTTATETSKEKFEAVNVETTTGVFEATEGLDSSTINNKNILSAEENQTEVGVIEMKLNRLATDRNPENSNAEEVPIKLTTSKDIENTAGNANFTAESTTTVYQMSEETSAELNAMISETAESIDEDPYIKLGETTTFKPLEINTQAFFTEIPEKNLTIQTPPKAILSTKTKPSLLLANHDQPHEEADEEDEDDQLGYHLAKEPNPNSRTTTLKPPVSTTRRLNTLKPVSYFNKKPVYALYQDPVEPLYNKLSVQSSNTKKVQTPLKVVNYSKPIPQQRPMQRPPQLSNLMISSTQSTRPPVQLEPSLSNSKGLEASIANLDEDISAFTKLCNELAFSYWKSITSEKVSSARSLIISPFALTSMLSMVFLGARGSTSGEMNDVLKLDDMVTFNPHLVFKNITDSVEKSIDSDIATTAFVREIYSDRANGKVLQFFKEKTQQLYAGHVEEVNFHVVNDIIRRRTNLLVKRHTMGKVLEYLRTNSVWVNGPLATISANLFQTDCSHGYTQDRDGELFFQVHPTIRQRRLVPIPAVLFKYGFTAGYEPNLDATVVAFGRIQDTTSMVYVMPGHLSSISPSDNLERLEKQLMETAISGNAWSNLLTSLMDRPGIEVQIPRFSHRSFINATTGLQKMGLKGLFKSDYADLGGLTGSSNRDIFLSDMIQINTFSTCGEEKIADHHHVEMYPAPPLRKRNKDVDVHHDDEQDSSEAVIDFGSIVQDPVIGRGFYDDLLDPKYLELPLPLRPRQARVPETPRLRFDKPFLYFIRHNPTGMILFMGRFNPRLLP